MCECGIVCIEIVYLCVCWFGFECELVECFGFMDVVVVLVLEGDDGIFE